MNKEVQAALSAAEHVARTLMKDQKGVIWPTIVIMEFDEKDNDIIMPPSDVKAWRHHDPESHSREWILKAWSAEPMNFNSPEFEIASFIRRKKGLYVVFIITESAMIVPPEGFDLPPGHSFRGASDEQAAELKRLSKFPPVQVLSIMVLTFFGFHHRALELKGPKNSPQRKIGKSMFDVEEATPPDWLLEAVKYSYTKFGKGELLN
jgi:hypothetical protein